MASFCTKCGTELTGSTQFCTSCGAPIGAAAVSAPPPAAYAPQGGGYVQPVPVPSGGGNSALKIILIIVGIFVGLGVLSICAVMFGVWRVSRAVHVANNGAVTLSTPGGTITAGNTVTVSADELGVDIYPGATHQQGGMTMTTAKGSTVSAVFSTSDPLEKVVDYYKDKLGSGASVFQSDKSAVLSSTSADNKNTVLVTVSEDQSNSGQTKISIVHSKSS